MSCHVQTALTVAAKPHACTKQKVKNLWDQPQGQKSFHHAHTSKTAASEQITAANRSIKQQDQRQQCKQPHFQTQIKIEQSQDKKKSVSYLATEKWCLKTSVKNTQSSMT